jgi:CRISPR/Cas system Type II protein with McrA/HNH and RuvC-like nuclease domain
MKFRLGLDIGANSIGWALFDLDDTGPPPGCGSWGSASFQTVATPKPRRRLRRNADWQDRCGAGATGTSRDEQHC